jgi:hypothetical protein
MADKEIAYVGPDNTLVEFTPTKPKEALPCPWCGTKPEMRPWHGGGINKQLIGCVSTRCEVVPSVTGESPKEAISKWNRRKN